MKKILILFICTVFLLSFSSCDNSDKKMKGFTYDELAEYLSSVDGLYQSPLAKNSYFLEEPIICGDKELNLRYSIIMNRKIINHHGYYNRLKYTAIDLNNFLQYQVWVKKDGPDGYEYSPVLSDKSFYSIEPLPKEDFYLGDPPNNFAYTLEAYGFNSSPHWSEWVKYNIPNQVSKDETQVHFSFSRYWYNPEANEFQDVVYLRKLEDATEIYIIYQEISMFFDKCPIIVSEGMYKQIRETYDEEENPWTVYKKISADEFIKWFMGEYVEERPAAFSKMKNDVYCYDYDGDIHWDSFFSKDPSLVIADMKNLGVNFDELRSYIIKATVPHDGTVQDIFWELIG